MYWDTTLVSLPRAGPPTDRYIYPSDPKADHQMECQDEVWHPTCATMFNLPNGLRDPENVMHRATNGLHAYSPSCETALPELAATIVEDPA